MEKKKKNHNQIWKIKKNKNFILKDAIEKNKIK